MNSDFSIRLAVAVLLGPLCLLSGHVLAEGAVRDVRIDIAQNEGTGNFNSIIEKALDSVERAGPASDSGLQGTIDSLDVVGEDISNVLKLITQKTQTEFLIDPDVSGQVTISIKNIDLEDALRIVLEPNALAFALRDGKVRIMTQTTFVEEFGARFNAEVQTKTIALLNAKPTDLINTLTKMKSPEGKVIYNEQANTFILIDNPAKITAMSDLIKKLDVPIETDSFPLKFISAREVVRRAKSMVTENIGWIQADEATNSVIVTDSVHKIEEIKKLIDQIDTPSREISLEARIVQIVLSDEHANGVDWEAIVSNFTSQDLTDLNGKFDASKSLSLGTISPDDLAILLEALDTVGEVNDVSRIKTSTSMNKTVEVAVKAVDLIELESDRTNPTNVKRENIRFYLTPQEGADGKIQFLLKSEFDLAQDKTVNKETSLDVEEKSSIVIGGIFKNIKVESLWKIPLLGDLPILGFAFRNEGETIRKTEIIIFITPSFINEETGQTNNGA